MTADAFAHALTVINNAYDQAAADIQQAALAVQFAGEHIGHQDQISMAQYNIGENHPPAPRPITGEAMHTTLEATKG